MKKLTNIDRLETLLMDCSPEEFLILMERVDTIKRLRMIQVRSNDKRKPAEKAAEATQALLDHFDVKAIGNICNDIQPKGGYICTLPIGHAGEHIAKDDGDKECARW